MSLDDPSAVPWGPPPPSAAPPPYTQPHFATETPSLSQCQLELLASCQGTIYECSCVLEDRFVLLGHSDGVQVMDLVQSDRRPKQILWVRARQMALIESGRVVLLLAGRNKQIRVYALDALLRLCYAVLRLDWESRRDRLHTVPRLDLWQQMASLCGKVPTKDKSDHAPEDVSSLDLSSATDPVLPQPSRASPSSQHSTADHLILTGIARPYYTCNKLILQDFCYKFPDSKDALHIHTYQTSAYVFVAVLHRDKIVLWQRKLDKLLRPFYRLKVFWIPMEPRSITFADDRTSLKHIVAVFQTEATVIGLRDSKVHTVPIDAKLTELHQSAWIRSHYDNQQHPHHPHSQYPMPTSQTPATFPTLPSSSAPPPQWTSLIQLPFYPDTLPASSLTTAYSIPPSYSTVVTAAPSSAPDPVALPSVAAPQLFFATFGTQSFIIDLDGALFSTQMYNWCEAPDHLEFINVAPHGWCVVGFGAKTIDILHVETGKRIQRVMHGVPIKFLGRWHSTEKRSQALYWTCALRERIDVYMLRL